MKILGTGSYLPPRVVTNEQIENWGEANAEWTYKKLGIKERRVTFSTSSVIGAKAASLALLDSGLKDVDVIIVATATPDKLTPSTAILIQDRLKSNAIAFDINAVCSGFVYALAVANGLLERYCSILVVGVDTFSHITNWNTRDCVFFGDGAGAVVVTKGGNCQYDLYSKGDGKEAFETEHGGSFRMKGREVYKAGTTYLPKAVKSIIKDTEIDWVLPHQASILMLKEMAKKSGLPWEKVLTNMEQYGNTAAASIPILLDENEFNEGDKLLLVTIGSGWTYGVMIIEW